MPRIALGTHAYAPELNTAYIAPPGAKTMGECIERRVPGVTSIREARAMLFPKPCKPHIWAKVSTTYPEEWASLNREYSGVVARREIAVNLAREIREREKGGPLLDGRILPAPTVTVTTKLIGG
jgi:hypothetical protein